VRRVQWALIVMGPKPGTPSHLLALPTFARYPMEEGMDGRCIIPGRVCQIHERLTALGRGDARWFRATHVSAATQT
jgi:hypothetical protein